MAAITDDGDYVLFYNGESVGNISFAEAKTVHRAMVNAASGLGGVVEIDHGGLTETFLITPGVAVVLKKVRAA
ncbi:hypothetical protein [Psychromicrobium lacuslunae]|uniref:Uncharacterized protein n=1 Tax=Psychromicrobium lacuslunae TaxID=1618207 RepID=A0A0D4C261_9MICC|nr:hypothetical protein [Psychromicrobium lacuslunae]AJT42619.1 hypothetical protein UM93_16135 [Psychromicrobium lacuslunae]